MEDRAANWEHRRSPSTFAGTELMQDINDNDADQAEGGTNARSVTDTIAGMGPGIPDDALAPGEDELPTPPTDEEIRRVARALNAPVPERDA
jgi:hypothetical protein